MSRRICMILGQDGSVAVDIEEPPVQCAQTDARLRAVCELLGVEFTQIRNRDGAPPVPDGVPDKVRGT